MSEINPLNVGQLLRAYVNKNRIRQSDWARKAAVNHKKQIIIPPIYLTTTIFLLADIVPFVQRNR